MYYGLYISAEGAMAQSTRMETISNNLANVGTGGFKRDLAIMQARYAQETQQGLDYPGSRTRNDLGGGVLVAATQTDHTQGPMKNTGIDTDLAIRGEGFFVVRRGNENLLTRSGNFAFNDQGGLVTPDGYPVLDEGGTPVIVDQTIPYRITPSGTIQQAGSEISLQMVKPRSLGDLSKVGENFFSPLAPTAPLLPEERDVATGFLEQSGVKPTQEMMSMIETSRVFEANVNMIRHQDQMLNSLVNRVLKVS